VNYLTNTTTLIINWVNLAQSTNLVEWIEGFGFHAYIEKGLLLILHEDNIGTTLAIIKDNIGSLQSILTNQLSTLTSGGLSVVSSIGNSIVNTGLIAVTTFLMVLERKRIGAFILDIAPTDIERYLHEHYTSIQQVTTAWIKATLILSASIFTATYVGLTLIDWIFDIDTEQAFTLALIGGIMEFIPYIGPLIALIPAAIVGLGLGWQAAVIIIILYLLIQRLENDILVPVVMSKALDLSPFLVFSVMLIGGTL
jgi:predicted PurR-regulated permease PerM